MKSAMIFINCLFIIKSNFLGRRFLAERQLNAQNNFVVEATVLVPDPYE